MTKLATTFTQPGEVTIVKGEFDEALCRRTARLLGPLAMFRASESRLSVLRNELPINAARRRKDYATHDFAGGYTDRTDIPRLLMPFIDKLDPLFPEGFDELSLLRIRRIAKRVTGDHLDRSPDYRHAVVIKGRGWLAHRPQMSASMKEAVHEPIGTGDRFTLNNTVFSGRLLHQAIPDEPLVIAIYGKKMSDN